MSDEDRYKEIRKRMRRDNAIFLAMTALSGLAVLVEYMLGIFGIVIILTIVTFVWFMVFTVMRGIMADRLVKNWSQYIPDERMQKIDNMSRALSWLLTFGIVGLLAGLAAFHIFDLGTFTTLILVLMVMAYSWIFLKWYYGRKGDVE